MTEIEQLRAILNEDFGALTSIGDRCDGFEAIEREFQEELRWHDLHQMITRGSSGKTAFLGGILNGLPECPSPSGWMYKNDRG